MHFFFPCWSSHLISHSHCPRSMALTFNLKCSSSTVCSFGSSVWTTGPLSTIGTRVSFLPFPLKPRNGRRTSLNRRLFVIPSISAVWDALTGRISDPRKSIEAIRRGMLLFRQGDVLASLSEFDKAIELDPRQKAYLWQRGLSLYYLDRFEEGAAQFRVDVAMNPNDTEESLWCFLCEAQLYGVDSARKQFLEVGRDPRRVMRKAYNMFKDGGDPQKIMEEFLNGGDSEYFYASLYAGLYCEAQKEPDRAKLHIIAACQSPYGRRSDDYMASLARVHCLCRNWEFS